MKVVNKVVLLIVGTLLTSCAATDSTGISVRSEAEIKKTIQSTLDNWHLAAAESDFEAYFSFLTKDAIYIGTDATENWNVSEFKKFAKPYFKKGKTWSFLPLKRNIYLSKNGKTAWFDELLQTHMGICRGSGVLVKNEGEWKLKHFVLSITVPNEQVEKVTQLKHDFDERYAKKLLLDEN